MFFVYNILLLFCLKNENSLCPGNITPTVISLTHCFQRDCVFLKRQNPVLAASRQLLSLLDICQTNMIYLFPEMKNLCSGHLTPTFIMLSNFPKITHYLSEKSFRIAPYISNLYNIYIYICIW